MKDQGQKVQAEIQRDWENVFAQRFPGWSREALTMVASFAGISYKEFMLLDTERESDAIAIYRKAIDKKKAAMR